MADYNKSRRSKRSGKSYRYLPITILLFAVALIIGLSGFFRVSDIIVTGENLYTEDEIIEAAEIENGDNLIFFNESKAGAKICNKLSYVGNVKVIVKLPSTVEIQVNESVAIASIENEGSYWIIDTEGKLLEQTDLNGAADVIAVTGAEIFEPVVGETIQTKDAIKRIYLIDILKAIYDNGAADKITTLDITSIANIKFDYDGRFEIDYGEGGNSSVKFASLIRIINDTDTADSGKIEIDSEGRVHIIPE